MHCINCGREREDHADLNGKRVCIGRSAEYAPDITKIEANFIFVGANGVAQNERVTVVENNRRLARVDNIIERMLREGCTRISVNIYQE